VAEPEMPKSAEVTAAMNVWTDAMTTDRVQNILYRVGQWYRLSAAEIEARIARGHGENGFWRRLQQARSEWEHGWPPAMADTAKVLGIDSALCLDPGMGEVGLHLHSWANILIQFVDMPGPAREFLVWRIGQHLSSRLPRPLLPDELLGLPATEQWDAVLCLEACGPESLRRVLGRARKAVCIASTNGQNLHEVLETEGWKQHSGGEKPHWYVRAGNRDAASCSAATSISACTAGRTAPEPTDNR